MSRKKASSSHDKEVKTSGKKTGVSKVEKIKKSILKNAPEENCFILCNGQQVKNVKELADALEVLDDDVFNHHVTFDRNDFANWIKDVFKDEE
ncbi:MAG: hypothetical protein PHV16_04965, partial [Candidatus Nanoarchaeia archaeon]|nr:hypothetical protein [Candidatus Nanoarchaeia archaeon]